MTSPSDPDREFRKRRRDAISPPKPVPKLAPKLASGLKRWCSNCKHGVGFKLAPNCEIGFGFNADYKRYVEIKPMGMDSPGDCSAWELKTPEPSAASKTREQGRLTPLKST